MVGNPGIPCGSRAAAPKGRRTPTGSTCRDPIADAIKGLASRITALEQALEKLAGERDTAVDTAAELRPLDPRKGRTPRAAK